jgi:K+-sensing histidine kinase KdpD
MSEARCVDAEEIRRLLGGLVHDLRNPLAALVTNLAFARRLVAEGGPSAGTGATPSSELDDALGESEIACEALRHLVANLEVLARPNEAVRARREVDVREAIREAVERCRPRANLAGVALLIREGPSLHRRRVDPGALGLALENLVCDAVRMATRDATVVVSVDETAEITTVRVVAPNHPGSTSATPAPVATSEAPTARSRVDRGDAKRDTALALARIAADLGGFDVGGDVLDTERVSTVSIRGAALSAG